MKYNSNNPPLICMQTQSTCYKGTSKIKPIGILWHSTGTNNPNINRYVQPSNPADIRDTISVTELGKNKYSNDWNHIKRQAGLNAWVGKIANGSVVSIQTMPWNFEPWGCGGGSKGSCNDTHIQFEICEDSLSDINYFNAVYKEACELTAYLCQMFNIDPHGTINFNGVIVPTIICHQDAYKLKLGSNHGDIYHWFNRYGKTMDDVRNDVAALMGGSTTSIPTTTIKTPTNISITYQTWDDVKNKWLPNVTNDSDYAGIIGNDVCAVYANLSSGSCTYKVHTQNGRWLPAVTDRSDYAGVFNKPIDAFMIKSNDPNVIIHYQVHTRGGKWLPYVTGYSESDGNNGYAGVIGKPIDGIRMYVQVQETLRTVVSTPVEPEKEADIETAQQPVEPEITPTPVQSEFEPVVESPVEPVPEICTKPDIEVESELNVKEEVKSTDDNKINAIVSIIINVLKKLAEIFLNKLKNKGE